MAFRMINLAVAMLFFASAALQLNDPDPARWVAIWAAAGVACLADRRIRPAWLVPAVVGAMALLWALTGVGVLAEMTFSDLFREMKAQTPVIEESREFLGLAIIAAWMTVLTFRGLRDRSHHESADD
jgi:hypothetical protein